MNASKGLEGCLARMKMYKAGGNSTETVCELNGLLCIMHSSLGKPFMSFTNFLSSPLAKQ